MHLRVQRGLPFLYVVLARDEVSGATRTAKASRVALCTARRSRMRLNDRALHDLTGIAPSPFFHSLTYTHTHTYSKVPIPHRALQARYPT